MSAKRVPVKARDVRVGDYVAPSYFVGIGRGWKAVSVKVRGEDVLIDVENEGGGGVHSLPALGVDDTVKVTR